MQEGDALNALTFPALALAGLLRRTRLFVPVRLRRGIITTTAAGTASSDSGSSNSGTTIVRYAGVSPAPGFPSRE